MLGDDSDGSAGGSVEEFYKDFATVTGLANNGRGMAAKERLIVLRSCLQGSRKTAYDVILRSHEKDGLVEDKPEKVWAEVRDRLMLFQITPVERQLRAKAAYDNLYLRYGMTARQFEAI